MFNKKAISKKILFILTILVILFGLYLVLAGDLSSSDASKEDIGKSTDVSQTLMSILLSNQETSKYIIERQDGNESFYDVTFDYITGNLVNINFKLNQDKLDKEGKTLKDYSYEPSLKQSLQIGEDAKAVQQLDIAVTDKDSKPKTPTVDVKTQDKVILTKDDVASFSYLANPQTDKYLKFGEHSIVIIWNISYSNNMIGLNTTSELNNISHISINNLVAPYNSLVGYWNFDADAPRGFWTTGKVNGSGNFNGFNNYINLGTNPFVPDNNSFSISIWVKPTSSVAAATAIYAFTYGSGVLATNKFAVGSPSLNRNRVACMIGNGTTSRNTTEIVLPLNVWSHIGCVYDKTNLTIYLNGAVNSTTIPIINDTTTGGSVLTIGAGYLGANGFWTGGIDEVKLWARNISSTEMLDIYNNESTGVNNNFNKTNLTFSAGLNELDGTYVNTTSPTNIYGFLNPPIVSDWTNFHNDGNYKLGAYNTQYGCLYDNCAGFDGVDDYINLTSSNSLNISQDLTISLWMKSGMIVSPSSRSLINKDTFGGDKRAFTINLFANTGQISGSIFTNNSYAGIATSSTRVNNSIWHHVVMVKDSANQSLKIYIDGVVNASSYNSNYSNPFIGNYSDSTLLGKDVASLRYYNGTLDEVMIFNTSLNSSQVLQIYNNQSPRFYSYGEIHSNYTTNITAGNNRINVSLTDFENNLGTNISLSLFYYTDQDSSWHQTTYQNITVENMNYTYNITANTSRLLLYTYLLSDLYSFYSPILGGNAILDTFNDTTNYGGATDNDYPQFSNYLDNNASIITSGIALFNVTITSTNGTAFIQVGTTNYSTTNLTATMYNLSTTLTTGTYPYYWGAWGNGTSHNYNSSLIRYYTVNASGVDTTAPYFTGIPLNASIIFGQNFNTDFNATDETAFGTFAVNNSKFTINQSGWLNNNTPLGVGTYYLNVSINDTTGNTNYTIFKLDVNKTYPLLSLTVTSPISYETTSDFLGSESNSDDGGCSYNLNISNAVYPVGVTWANYSTNGCENYSANSTVKGLTVNKNNTFVLAISRTTPISYEKATDFSGSGCPSQLSCSLNLTNQVYQAGTIYTNYSTVGNANYSAGSITSSILINKNSTYTLGITRTTPITYGTLTDFSGTNCPSQLTNCALNITNQIYPAGTTWANYSSAGNSNYSASSITSSILINKATSLVYTYLNNSRASISIRTNQSIQINSTLITGDINMGLNLTKDNLQLNYSTIVNLTYLFNLSYSGVFYIMTNYTGNQNYSNSNETWIITVTNPGVDTIYPIFSGYILSPINNTKYGTGRIYWFNVTVVNTNGTAGMQFNGINYSLLNISNNFYKTLDLGAGTYPYYFFGYGNGTSNLYNSSATNYYTVAINTTTFNQMFITNTKEITYGVSTDFSGSETNTGDGGCSYALNISNLIYPAGIILANYSTNGCTNYSAGSINSYTNISKASSQTSLTFDKTSPQSYPNSITPTCTILIGQGSTNLTNGTSGISVILGAKTWSFNCSYSGNTNYTQSSNFSQFIINQNNTYALGMTKTTPITYGTITDFSGTSCPTELTCSLNMTNGIFTAGTVWANYSTSGNNNYSSNSNVDSITINKANSIVYMFINGTRSDENYFNQSIVWLNTTLITNQINGGLNMTINNIQLNYSTTMNLTYLYNFSLEGTFVIKSNYTGNQNFTPSYESWTVIVTNTSGSIPPVIIPPSGGGGMPISVTNDLNKYYNKTYICEQAKIFNQLYDNYTPNEYQTFKSQLSINQGMAIPDDLLKLFIKDYNSTCSEYNEPKGVSIPKEKYDLFPVIIFTITMVLMVLVILIYSKVKELELKNLVFKKAVKQMYES